MPLPPDAELPPIYPMDIPGDDYATMIGRWECRKKGNRTRCVRSPDPFFDRILILVYGGAAVTILRAHAMTTSSRLSLR
jgi:hypothetical protein